MEIKIRYLRICEGATELEDGSANPSTGKLISYLVADSLPDASMASLRHPIPTSKRSLFITLSSREPMARLYAKVTEPPERKYQVSPPLADSFKDFNTQKHKIIHVAS